MDKDRKSQDTTQNGNDIPEHLKHFPGLYIRERDRIVEASPADQSVARSYPRYSNKGPITGGRRLTILTKKTTYTVNEEIRVIHVFEATESGDEVYVMGPKEVYGEYLDGHLATKSPPDVEDPWIPDIYDGAVLPSPAVDYNYEITSYKFSQPGTHQLYWNLGSLQSNVLIIEITEQ